MSKEKGTRLAVCQRGNSGREVWEREEFSVIQAPVREIWVGRLCLGFFFTKGAEGTQEKCGEAARRAQQAKARESGDQEAFRAETQGDAIAAALDAGDFAEQGRGGDPAVGGRKVVALGEESSRAAGDDAMNHQMGRGRMDEGDDLTQNRRARAQGDDADHVAVLNPGRHAAAASAEAEGQAAREHGPHERKQARPGERQPFNTADAGGRHAK